MENINILRDRFGNILSKNTIVAYVENGVIECGSVIEAVRVGMPSSEIVRIEPFENNARLVIKPANEVMSIILPAT